MTSEPDAPLWRELEAKPMAQDIYIQLVERAANVHPPAREAPIREDL